MDVSVAKNMGSRISVVINTFNEEKNLPYAIRSVQTWVDEIIVVDMHSDDGTAEIARGLGAKVYFHHRTGFVEPARAFAIDRASGDWVLLLDADEIAPFSLSRKLRAIADGKEEVDIVRLPRLNYILQTPLRFTGWGPKQDLQMRFFKRQSLVATSTIHGGLKPKPGARVFEIPYREGDAVVHFPYADLTEFIEKLNRYTSVEASQALARGEHVTYLGALVRAGKEFAIRYFGLRGYRDGWRGFYLALFMSFYRVAASAKLEELENIRTGDQVRCVYTQEAERLLSEYHHAAQPVKPTNTE